MQQAYCCLKGDIKRESFWPKMWAANECVHQIL